MSSKYNRIKGERDWRIEKKLNQIIITPDISEDEENI